ncbi:hypothetical protein PR048_020398 [Dryococelus australis]|uniref:Uncharacterized protein n=1 Tax=Dryococelus australis TaxID=614101 RepID=A0ABQ9H6B2_9NEOP|nr:hypothetical protein PR048_020398 [Dryococelus australis]
MTLWVYKVDKPTLLVNLKAANLNVIDSESIYKLRKKVTELLKSIDTGKECLSIQSNFSNIIAREIASSSLGTVSNMKSGDPDSLMQFCLEIDCLHYDIKLLQAVMSDTLGVVTE